MHLGIIALVFGVIFIAELPDKSMLASLVLSSRMPPLWVWLGASAAFLVHVLIAVSAGHFLTLLPDRLVEGIVALLFLGGAAVVWFGRHGLEDARKRAPAVPTAQTHKFWKVFSASFGVIFIGEWGDITQIATANYAAKYQDPLSVVVGASLGLWAVTGLGIFVGAKALTLVPPKILQRVTALILLGFGIFSAIAALR